MKEVMAFIRVKKISKTKKALLNAGFPSMTCRNILGRGKKKVDFKLTISPLQAAREIPELYEASSEEHRLVPKRLITLIVKDDEVEKVVEAIMEVNSTGNPGDGKIFIIPINEAYRIRTGETGEHAL
ncbi:P-II family nitrogen regulator [Clostridium chromiireducens]|uniref:P-II family nitrogen regulator n=1 Tax=Clostridium chromiireducens TaxID=225345 RepID=UPI003AF7BEF4